MIMMTVAGIDVDGECLAAIAHRYGIAELRVLGSRARQDIRNSTQSNTTRYQLRRGSLGVAVEPDELLYL